MRREIVTCDVCGKEKPDRYGSSLGWSALKPAIASLGLFFELDLCPDCQDEFWKRWAALDPRNCRVAWLQLQQQEHTDG